MNTAKRKTTRNQKGDSFQEKVIQISRVTKVCKGGKKLAFRAVIAVGNENGKVGVGVGKADDVVNAISKAIVDAKRNLIDVFLTKTKTIPHNVTGNFGACSVLVKPASQGTGVIAGGAVRTVLEAVGVQNVLSKSQGSSNPHNVVKATFDALLNLRSPLMISKQRGISLDKVFKG